MTDDKIELTRRKILGSVGAVGAAGAAAGLGTSALFSDDESFEDNVITAGTLDMKVDWEEHYSFPQYYGLGDPADGLDVTRTEPSDTSNYTAFPPGVEADDDGEPILWVHNDDVQAYHDATSIEAFPDTDTNGTADDGVQDDFNPENACTVLSDLDGGDGALNSGARTDNAATNPGDPLIQLQDIKPGDFGEATLSFHLCDNPGYVWLNGELVSASENSVTEPEAEVDPDNSTPTQSTSGNGEGELLDEIQTAWWYDDNCDNLTQAGGGGGGSEALCVQIVLDASGSMSGSKNTNTIAGAQALAQEILNANDDSRVGVTFFSASGYSSGAQVQQSVASTDDADNDGDVDPQDIDTTQSVIGGLPASGGSTAIGAGIEEARADLQNCPDSLKRVMVVLSNGGENVESDSTVISRADDACTNDDIEIATIAVGSGADTSFLEKIACKPGQLDAPENAFTSLDPANIESEFQQLSGEVLLGGEEIFYQDTLGNALDALTSGDGIPLDGDGGDDFDEINDPPSADSRGCFEATPTTNCIGFSWWVPTDVDNRIQSDSVEFDLGFYAEQCRNNDGSGSASTPTSTPTPTPET